MPELPEVETVKRTLNELIIDKKIEKVTVTLARIIIKPDDVPLFSALLQGQTFRSVHRRGKFLRLMLDDYTLVSHLRMEGKYGLYEADDAVDKHTHVIFHFTDGTELRYNDVRQFGTMHLFAKDDDLSARPLSQLGLEPFASDFTAASLTTLLQNKKSKIKSLLLNQSYVVGIGNIYADEILYAANIHPERTADQLSQEDMQKLHTAIVAILQEAVNKGGSSIKSYVNGQGEMGMFQQQLRVYGRKEEPCFTCGTPLNKIVVGGRGTHYCTQCQS
ncbi:DNA-formamidopyrimidine glycosylase [Longirhabdus pacifica]|uniref:DNA-formamidopyrimidine glycosylase n=1 Tax=Longirhabdus pacifica TaxID=2305227 RepID=UPI001008F256|nr:DNA-formamidopyrimidine glycosylase [Longirhabdus pacifica]